MTQPRDVTGAMDSEKSVEDTRESQAETTPIPQWSPSNEVYARVGDVILHAAQAGVRRGVRPEDIIRDIASEHNVRLSLGELRLLLATRPRPRAPKAVSET